MKVKIDNLGIETTLKEFVEDWDLDINEINEELKNSSSYSDDYVEIELENNIINVSILTIDWGVKDIVNNIYNDQYLFIIKDVYNGDNDEYTKFSIENPTPETYDIVFEGGEYDKKTILNEEQLSKFYKQRDEGNIDWTDLLKYQRVWFVKKKDLIDNGWEKIIESFNLFDWDQYPYESSKKILKESSKKILKEYFPSGSLRSTVLSKNGVRDGQMKIYYETGELHGEFPVVDGKENGIRKQYYKSGELEFESIFINGFEEGPYKFYGEKGNINQEGIFKKSLVNGLVKDYYPNGKLKKERVFNNGEVNSQKCWDEDGNETECE